MGSRTAVVFGRDAGCDVHVEHGSISSRHARLSIDAGALLLEDLGSRNGTYLREERTARAYVRDGDDARLGDVPFPWSHPTVRALIAQLPKVHGATIVSATAPMPRAQCGSCGSKLVVPPGIAQVKCPRCGTVLDTQAKAKRPARGSSAARWVLLTTLPVLIAVGIVLGAASYNRARSNATSPIPFLPAPLVAEEEGVPAGPPQPAATSPEEEAVRQTRVPGILAAIDPMDPTTRNTAARIAAGSEGPFHVEQVARIWTHVRGRFRYVNDPDTGEYFAKASETIANEYVGDCDDFAVVLASMIRSIGGDARIVVMDGPGGGHAYAEACVRSEPQEVANRLKRHYNRTWDRYLGRQRITQVHYRTTAECPMWLNLDWSAGVPGGPYAEETWSVAIAADGSTTTLKSPNGERAATEMTVRTTAVPP